MRTVLDRMKIHISYFYFLSYGQFTVTSGVAPIKIKVVQKWPNLQERYALLWQWFFSSSDVFVRHLIFEIWSILCMVDFDQDHFLVGDTPHVYKIDHISKTKSRIKNSCTKKSFSGQCAPFLKIWPLLNNFNLFGGTPGITVIFVLTQTLTRR